MKISLLRSSCIIQEGCRPFVTAEGEGNKSYIFKPKAPLCNQILFRWNPEPGHPNESKSKGSRSDPSVPRQCGVLYWSQISLDHLFLPL